MHKVKLLHSHYTGYRCFPVKFVKLLRTTWEHQQICKISANSCFCKVLFINCWFCNYVSQSFKSFCQTGDNFFYGSEVHSLLIPFSKESMKVKKASNFGVDVSWNPNAGQKKTISTQKKKGKANKNPEKVVKHVDLCDDYGSPVHQPKQPNPPPNGCIVILLKFVHSNVSTRYSCGGQFYHQGYPGDLVAVSKTKHVFVSPVTHERMQSTEFSNVYFHFNFACIFTHDRCFASQLIQIEQDVIFWRRKFSKLVDCH